MWAIPVNRKEYAMNLAIIGCGGMGKLHAEMASNCGLRVVACADIVHKAAMFAAAPYRAKVFADPMSAIKSREVDIVVITTPTPVHEKVCGGCCERRQAHIL
jgi:predicted dehydrogenase